MELHGLQDQAQQIQNLNGVAMYLRGKEAPESTEVSEDTDKES